MVLVALDECDYLQAPSPLMYELSRASATVLSGLDMCLSVICLGNAPMVFEERLDSATKSTLLDGGYSMVLSPYNAAQLGDILADRVELAFGPGVVDEETIPLCAALAAKDSGNARYAIHLLRVAAEEADRRGDEHVDVAHVQWATGKIEVGCIEEVIHTLPLHSQMVLLGLYHRSKNKIDVVGISTGEVYEAYGRLCQRRGMSMLTQRRITDLISELDMLGIVHTNVHSRGKYGRTREISLAIPPRVVWDSIQPPEETQEARV